MCWRSKVQKKRKQQNTERIWWVVKRATALKRPIDETKAQSLWVRIAQSYDKNLTCVHMGVDELSAPSLGFTEKAHSYFLEAREELGLNYQVRQLKFQMSGTRGDTLETRNTVSEGCAMKVLSSLSDVFPQLSAGQKSKTDVCVTVPGSPHWPLMQKITCFCSHPFTHN